ncbi:MAG: hypothetical protein MZW92_44765 [Comamonadaceae bacterium]|nr:hypothetical protein [Comamonadaceae bacterium]
MALLKIFTSKLDLPLIGYAIALQPELRPRLRAHLHAAPDHRHQAAGDDRADASPATSAASAGSAVLREADLERVVDLIVGRGAHASSRRSSAT